MTNIVDLNKYKDFVEKVTSEESNDNKSLYERMGYLNGEEHGCPVNISLLVTGGIGLSSETGELNEIIKKVLFQGEYRNGKLYGQGTITFPDGIKYVIINGEFAVDNYEFMKIKAGKVLRKNQIN